MIDCTDLYRAQKSLPGVYEYHRHPSVSSQASLHSLRLAAAEWPRYSPVHSPEIRQERASQMRSPLKQKPFTNVSFNSHPVLRT